MWDENYMERLVSTAGASAALAPRRDPRIVIGVLVVVAAAVVGLAAFVTSLVLDDDPDQSAGPDAVSTGTPTAGPPQSVPPGGPGTDAPPQSAPPVVPADGAAVLSATVAAGDLLQVSEVVPWPAGGAAELTLETSDLTTASGIAGDFDPEVTELRVSVDGAELEAVPVEGSTTQWVVTVPNPSADSTVEVTYVLAGAIVRSVPSTDGRGLGVVAPLTRNLLGSTPLRVEFTGDAVLSIACPGAPDLVGQLCGRMGDGGWTADAPAGDPPVVTIQLNLPPVA